MKRKLLSVLLALVLVLSFSLVTALPVAAAGVDWYVDASVTTSGDGTSSEIAFKTIQEGVNAADPAGGDTVNVAAGTYSTATNGESFPITIDTPLTLKGARFGVDPTAEGARTEESEESVIDSNDDEGNAIEISVNDVTIDGFVIKNVHDEPTDANPAAKYGIKVMPQSGDHSSYSSDITIQNNVLTENSRGIFLFDNENSVVRKNRIEKCASTTTGTYGWYHGGSGIVLSFVKPTTVVTENLLTENVAKTSYYGPILVSANGEIGGETTQPTITLNQIVNNYTEGTIAYGIMLCGASAIVRGNIITGNEGGGIWAHDFYAIPPIPILIEDNMIAENGLEGILLCNELVVGITGNTIVGNVGIGVSILGQPTDLTLHENSIFGNGSGVSSNVPTDAEYNWWGDASGPGGVGAGAGDTISENVDYSPWCTDSGYTETSHIQVDVGDYVFNTIQEAIDAASSGDTINVAAGIYDSSIETFPITIDKSLTLLGAQANADPRPSQGGRTGDESIIDADETSSAVIQISASDVEINGFTITGGRCDMVEESGSADNLLFRYNILYDDLETCNPGDEGIQIKYSDGVVMEFNYAYNIWEDAFNLSESTNGAIRYNEAHDIYSENAAIYCYGSSEHPIDNIEIRGNLIYDVLNNDGIKLGDKEEADVLTDSNSVIAQNIVHDTAQDGISVYTSGVTVEGNEVYNSSSENGAIYLAFAISDIIIQNNSVHDNVLNPSSTKPHVGGIGIESPVDAASVHINFNNIYNNTPYGVNNDATATVDATDNYWGNASGPQPDGAVYTSYGDKVSTGVDYNPWLLKKVVPYVKPPTFDKTLALKDGWTLVSTDKAVADSAWVGSIMEYKYTPTSDFVSEVALADLKPLTALYMKTVGGGGVGINYAADGAPAFYSKELEAGWNLISIPDMEVADIYAILSPLRYVTIGTQQGIGLTTLVSQGDYNQFSESFYEATLTNEDWDNLPPLELFDGYWANMEAAETFEVPVP